MSLLESLKEKAAEAVNDEERQREWVEKGYDKALEEARALLPQADDEGELKALREAAEDGLDKLERNRENLVGLGTHGLRSAITLVGLGQYDAAAEHAALVKLREAASWGQVTDAITAAAESGNEAKRKLDAEIEALKDVFKEIGTAGAKALLPLLLAVI